VDRYEIITGHVKLKKRFDLWINKFVSDLKKDFKTMPKINWLLIRRIGLVSIGLIAIAFFIYAITYKSEKSITAVITHKATGTTSSGVPTFYIEYHKQSQDKIESTKITGTAYEKYTVGDITNLMERNTTTEGLLCSGAFIFLMGTIILIPLWNYEKKL